MWDTSFMLCRLPTQTANTSKTDWDWAVSSPSCVTLSNTTNALWRKTPACHEEVSTGHAPGWVLIASSVIFQFCFGLFCFFFVSPFKFQFCMFRLFNPYEWHGSFTCFCCLLSFMVLTAALVLLLSCFFQLCPWDQFGFHLPSFLYCFFCKSCTFDDLEYFLSWGGDRIVSVLRRLQPHYKLWGTFSCTIRVTSVTV